MTKPKVAVIPVAGKGTRWMPVTRNVPKELLPVWRRTSASYAFEEAVNAGFEEIILVISPEKHDVLDHFMRFDSSDLGPRYEGESLSELHHRVKVRACIQEVPRGLGDAILCAEQDVAGRPFGVLLPDEVLMTNGIAMLDPHTPSVLLMEVPFAQRSNYGIVKGEMVDGSFIISDLVEKPEPALAPSSLAVTGRYTFTPEIFDYLRTQQPGKGGEIQLTDAMRRYTQAYPIHGFIYRDVRYDAGQPLGLLTASVDFALRDKSYGNEVRQMIQALLEQHKASETE